jgi:hypothetical protein
MNRSRLTVVIAALMSISAAVFAGDASDPLKEIAGYREWNRMNAKPIENFTPSP